VARPAGGGDQLERGLLQDARHEEIVGEAGGAQALQRRPPGADGADAQPRGGALGERADMDDMAVGILGRQRRRRVALEREVPRPVVLQHEGPGLGRGGQHGAPPLRRQHRAGRIGIGRLAVEEAGAGAPEGLGQQVGPHALGIGRHRHDAQAGPHGGGERAEIGRALDQHGIARRGQGAERRRYRALGAGADGHPRG
jgi:hypothetical protein